MTSLTSHPTPFRYDSRGKPTGLDWDVLSAGCPQDPSVWVKGSLVNPKRAGNRLPDETEMEIVRMHNEGVTATDIAQALEISTPTVAAVLDRHGVTEGRGRGTRQRTPDNVVDEVVRLYTEEKLGGQGIRNRLGLSHQTIYKILRRRGIQTRNKTKAAA